MSDKEIYYYEFIEGNSSKFWEITVKGNKFTTRYGKIGTDGRTTTKEWESSEKALEQVNKLRESKEKKGYILKP